MRRSLSGDRVIALPTGHHFKIGSLEVGRQARVMRKANALVPGIAAPVIACGERWHLTKTMPMLQEVEFGETRLDICRLTHLAIDRLSAIWSCNEEELYVPQRQGEAQPTFQQSALVRYLHERGAAMLFNYLPNMFDKLLEYCGADEATHGDCTFENMVFNVDVRENPVCFIDWLPYRRPYLPAHRDVDYGKLIQGLLGWNLNNFSRARLGLVRTLMAQRPMAGFWACVHYERIMARTNDRQIHLNCHANIQLLRNYAREEL
jgi:hypothetical protein